MPILTCKQNQSDFRPNGVLPLPIKAKRIYFKFFLFAECWYNSLGQDNYDFNKGPGLYQYFDFKKNHNSLVPGWRPKLDQYGFFEVVPYENVQGSNVPNEEKMIILAAEEMCYGYFEPAPDGWELWIIDKDGKETLWHKGQLNTQFVGKISGWFGGNRKAPHTMRMYLNFRN